MAGLFYRPGFNLPYPLAGHAQFTAKLIKCCRVIRQPTSFNDPLLSGGEGFEGFP